MAPGTRMNKSLSTYFPLADGNLWQYDKLVDGAVTAQVNRSVAAVAGSTSRFTLTETSLGDGTAPSSIRHEQSAAGLLALEPLADAGLSALQQALPQLLAYPDPFWPVSSRRDVIRQGPMPDTDGDGLPDSFRVEYRQTVVGIETLTRPAKVLQDTVRLRSTVILTLQPSRLDRPVTTAEGTEEVWLAPGIGPAQAIVTVVAPSGTPQSRPYTLRLKDGLIGGQRVWGPPPAPQLQRLSPTHNALVYDAPRKRYIATIPGSVLGVGNSLAFIDEVSGQVTHSAPIGSEPSALAVAADGSAVVVGLSGSAEVVKLRLPDLIEQWRVRLPAGFFGPSLPESIAISPIQPDIEAVALYRSAVSPRHDGVALIRNGVLQPRRTSDHTGSNLITFGADGTQLHGLNTETTEFGLRRIAVLQDGLQEEQVLWNAGQGFNTRYLERLGTGDRLLLGQVIHRVPGLERAGQINGDGPPCRWHAAAGRIVCLSTFLQPSVMLLQFDPTSFVLQRRTEVSPNGQVLRATPDLLVPGGPGRLAFSVPASSFGPGYRDELWLFHSPELEP